MLKYIFVILRKFAVSPMTILIEWPSSLKTEIETDTEMWAHVSTRRGVACVYICVCMFVCVLVCCRTQDMAEDVGVRVDKHDGVFLYRHVYVLFKENFWGMKLWKEGKLPVITSSFNTATIYSLYLLPTFFLPLDFCFFRNNHNHICVYVYSYMSLYLPCYSIAFISITLNIYLYSLLFLPKMKK